MSSTRSTALSRVLTLMKNTCEKVDGESSGKPSRSRREGPLIWLSYRVPGLVQPALVASLWWPRSGLSSAGHDIDSASSEKRLATSTCINSTDSGDIMEPRSGKQSQSTSNLTLAGLNRPCKGSCYTRSPGGPQMVITSVGWLHLYMQSVELGEFVWEGISRCLANSAGAALN